MYLHLYPYLVFTFFLIIFLWLVYICYIQWNAPYFASQCDLNSDLNWVNWAQNGGNYSQQSRKAGKWRQKTPPNLASAKFYQPELWSYSKHLHQGPMATAVLRACGTELPIANSTVTVGIGAPIVVRMGLRSACCIEIHKRLHMFETGGYAESGLQAVGGFRDFGNSNSLDFTRKERLERLKPPSRWGTDGLCLLVWWEGPSDVLCWGVDDVRLCLHIGVGCGEISILQVQFMTDLQTIWWQKGFIWHSKRKNISWNSGSILLYLLPLKIWKIQ